MITWPETLPQYPLKEGYSVKPVSMVVRTQMEGKIRVRKRFTKQLYNINATYRMSDSQKDAFMVFWENELQSGAESFEVMNGEVTLTDEPQVTPDGRYWRIGLQMISEKPI
jgi:hypothetical protein